MPFEGFGPAPGDRPRRVAALLERPRALECEQVRAGQRTHCDNHSSREPEKSPPTAFSLQLCQPVAEVDRSVGARIALFVDGQATSQALDVAGCQLPEQLHIGAIAGLELLGHPAKRALETQGL